MPSFQRGDSAMEQKILNPVQKLRCGSAANPQKAGIHYLR
jgi:hypothetical protein